MPYDPKARSPTGIAYVHLTSRHDLLRVTRMRAGMSDSSTLREEAVRGNPNNILTPDRAAWLRRAKRVEELLRGLRFTVAGGTGSAVDGNVTLPTDILTTTPCGRA